MAEPIRQTIPVLVVGGGPIGMMTAYQLSRLDTPCLLAEQALETTRWPKMDLTNGRWILHYLVYINSVKTVSYKHEQAGQWKFFECGASWTLIDRWVCLLNTNLTRISSPVWHLEVRKLPNG